MKCISPMIAVVFAALAMACAPVVVSDDGDVSQRDQALSSENCEEQCKEQFHECRESPDRGGGPGASACAHEKNDCESRC